MEWFLKAIKQYTDFKGRARRKEYWMFTLFSTIVAFVIVCIMLVGIVSDSLPLMMIFAGSYGIFSLFIFIPTLAVSVRRLHDAGKSGSMILVGLIPLVGIFWLVILYCTDSQYGENQWGPNPKGIGNQHDISEIGNTIIIK